MHKTVLSKILLYFLGLVILRILKQMPSINFCLSHSLASTSIYLSLNPYRSFWSFPRKHTHTDTDTLTHRHTQTHTHSHTNTHRHTDTHRLTQTHTHRDTHTWRTVSSGLLSLWSLVLSYQFNLRGWKRSSEHNQSLPVSAYFFSPLELL